MYRTCIYCAADLKANDVLERFPVGRSIAFDGAKGRLWAVCPRCARWNLAPIEERWEAIDDAERLFHDTRVRAQRENIGLAKLRDGTRLVRIGRAEPGELAAWRYGVSLRRRRNRFLVLGAASLGGSMLASSAFMMGGAAIGLYVAYHVVGGGIGRRRGRRVVYQPDEGPGAGVPIRRDDLPYARLDLGDAGLELHFPRLRADGRRSLAAVAELFAKPLVLRGDAARLVLGRTMVDINRGGAGQRELDSALAAIRSAGSPEALLLRVAREGRSVNGARGTAAPLTLRRVLEGIFDPDGWNRPLIGFDPVQKVPEGAPDPLMALAMEMALHEETERRALEGELAALEAMWRQAEEIAAIADALPGIPAPEPPRV